MSRSVVQSAREEPLTVLERLGSSVEGLPDDEALRRLAIHGENVLRPLEREPSADDPLALRSVCHLGASVESGSARAVVVETGRRTCLGGMAASLDLPEPPTAFDIGLERFTWLMVGFVAVMSPLVFLVNGVVREDARPHHSRTALRRPAPRGSGRAGTCMAQCPFPDRPEKPARPRDPEARTVA